MAHGDAREEKWRWNKRMEWVTSKRHVTAEHRLARAVQTLQADVHSSPASSRLNWRPRRFEWTSPFRRKMKSGFCACAITFQTHSTYQSLHKRRQLFSDDSKLQKRRCNIRFLVFVERTVSQPVERPRQIHLIVHVCCKEEPHVSSYTLGKSCIVKGVKMEVVIGWRSGTVGGVAGDCTTRSGTGRRRGMLKRLNRTFVS